MGVRRGMIVVVRILVYGLVSDKQSRMIYRWVELERMLKFLQSLSL